VTVAWLQISVLVVSVPVPVLKVQAAPVTGLQLEVLAPTKSGAAAVPGNMTGPGDPVPGVPQVLPGNVWSTMVHDSVEAPEGSVLITLMSALNVSPLTSGHVFCAMKPGVEQLKVARSKTVSPPVRSTIPVGKTGEHVRVAVSGSWRTPLTSRAATHSFGVVGPGPIPVMGAF
jgi:hypothetical protein